MSLSQPVQIHQGPASSNQGGRAGCQPLCPNCPSPRTETPPGHHSAVGGEASGLTTPSREAHGSRTSSSPAPPALGGQGPHLQRPRVLPASSAPGSSPGCWTRPCPQPWDGDAPSEIPPPTAWPPSPARPLQAPKMPESSPESPSGTQDELRGKGPPWKASSGLVSPASQGEPLRLSLPCTSIPILARCALRSPRPCPGKPSCHRPQQPGPHTIPDRRHLLGPQQRKWRDTRAFQICTPQTRSLLSSPPETRWTGCGRRCPRPAGWRS